MLQEDSDTRELQDSRMKDTGFGKRDYPYCQTFLLQYWDKDFLN
jgi:hypothetical protein